MSNILENKIKNIFKNNLCDSAQLVIYIKCPLEYSVTVIAKWVDYIKEQQPKLDGVKDFYFFVQEYRKNNPDKLFNRVLICANKSEITSIDFSFDEDLHEQTIENIQ